MVGSSQRGQLNGDLSMQQVPFFFPKSQPPDRTLA
jgi:hypothetical protein